MVTPFAWLWSTSATSCYSVTGPPAGTYYAGSTSGTTESGTEGGDFTETELGGTGYSAACSVVARPRIISDNGPQFIAGDFKEFIRICGMTDVRISPYYPQSNGKIECWHRSVKSECIRPGVPLSLEDGQRLVGDYVRRYSEVRLHSAIGYVTPADKLASRDLAISAARSLHMVLWLAMMYNVLRLGWTIGLCGDTT